MYLALYFLIVVNIFNVDCDQYFSARNVNYLKKIHDVDNSLDEETPEEELKIFPGTKWCGAGDIAENYDDLGEYEETDKCCRSHDNCNDIMNSYESKYNLTNPSLFTRLSCDCDEEFHECLKNSPERIQSDVVGFMYFTVVQTQCYKKEYPIKKCKERRVFPKIKCVDYELDETQEKVYQFFDVPNY